MDKQKRHMPTDVARKSYILRAKPGSLLVVHQFSEKAKSEIRNKQQKNVREKKGERKPKEEFEASKYLDEKGRECVPITAPKKALVSAARAFDDLKMVTLRQSLFIDSTLEPGSALLPICSADRKPLKGIMREDAVTIGNNIRGLTYRPQYWDWHLFIDVEWNTRILSEAQLDALVDAAGWGVGICEGRPERSSALGWGRFERV